MDEFIELRQEIVLRWSETHKKSMTSFLVMVSLSEQPMWSKEIAQWIENVTKWRINERSLYRTLQRMKESGLLQYEKTEALRTGADRKVYSLSELGRAVAADIKQEALKYEKSPTYLSNLESF